MKKPKRNAQLIRSGNDYVQRCEILSKASIIQGRTMDYISIYDVLNTPKAEVAPVVHCKDCENLMFSDCYGECSKGYLSIVNPDDYCSRGVRRKEGDNQWLNTFLSRG